MPIVPKNVDTNIVFSFKRPIWPKKYMYKYSLAPKPENDIGNIKAVVIIGTNK